MSVGRRGAVPAAAAPFVQAAGSIVVQLVAARELGPAGLATWALLFSFLVLLAAVSSGLVGDSLTVLDRSRVAVRSGLQGWATVVAALGGTGFAVAAGLSGLLRPDGAVLLGVTAAIFCAQELLRRLLMACDRFSSVVAVDAVTAVVTVSSLSLLAVNELRVEQVLLAVALGQAVGAGFAWWRLPPGDRRLGPVRRAAWREVWAFGGWRALQVSLRPAGLTAVRAVAIGVVGAAAVGPVEAARIFAAPAALLVNGAGSFLLVRFAREARGGRGARNRTLDRMALLLVGLALGVSAAAVLASREFGALVTGGSYPLPPLAVAGWGVYAAALALSVPYGTSAAVRGRPAAVAMTRVLELVLALSATWVLMVVEGLGAGVLPWSLAGAAVVSVPVLRRLSRTSAPARHSAAAVSSRRRFLRPWVVVVAGAVVAVLVVVGAVVGGAGRSLSAGPPAPSPSPSSPSLPAVVPARAEDPPRAGAGASQAAADVVVAPGGDDTAAGTVGAPLGSVGEAIRRVPDDGLVVVRGGTYHEDFEIPEGRRVHVAAAAGEEVWFDGAREVEGWRQDGAGWVSDGWEVELDSSPTYHWGVADSEAEGMQFVSPERPMAAHPDQVWLGGRALEQVATSAELRPGTFAVDVVASRLWLGEPPDGRRVEASALTVAAKVRGDGSSLTGLSFRRFAPSVAHLGAVRAEGDEILLSDLRVQEMSTTGLSVTGTGVLVERSVISGNGMLGVHANHADGLRLVDSDLRDNNTEGFNSAPVSGGVKVTRTVGAVLAGLVVSDNAGPGVWFDESTVEAVLTGSLVADNAGHGVSVEISQDVVLAGNRISGNGRNGVKINNSGDVDVWHNEVSRSERLVRVVQDERDPTQPGARGLDPRYGDERDQVRWLVSDISLGRNMLGPVAAGGVCGLCLEDTRDRLSGADMGVDLRANEWLVGAEGPPAILWPDEDGAVATYYDLDRFRAESGVDASSDPVDAWGVVTPPDVVEALGLPAPVDTVGPPRGG